ncbi:MAG: aspartate carbamoyltransferase regulatory subunit [Candidatus Lokiarchaeota archaeon]|nr:aspartate carbamoyltransferase regulatory subunit [Candidatus Lokiarchaeota archaeon]
MAEQTEKELRVRKIVQGTVIDHISPGKALIVMRLLGISESTGFPISIAINIPSSKLGKKDIIKLENIFLSESDFNKLALIAPKVTISKIQDMRIVQKSYVSIPDQIVGIVKCINPTCITNKAGEPISTKFTVLSKKPLSIKCEYCGRVMDFEEIMANLIFR